MAKVLDPQQPVHFTRTFLILLTHFCRGTGLAHCLTSKRIERNSVRMHLEGLRLLTRDLQSQSLPKK